MNAAPRPMNVLFVSSQDQSQSGDYVYRVRQPGRAMGRTGRARVVSISSLSPYAERLISTADVLVLDMVGEADIVAWVADRLGPVVYEMSDNAFDIQPFNPTYGFYKQPSNLTVVLQLLAMADAAQTTSNEITEEFDAYNDDILTIPNQLESVPPLGEFRGMKTLGWGGSMGHLEDLKLIAPHVIEWLSRHPDVKLRLMCADELFRVFDDVPDEQKEHVPTGTLEDYYDFIASLDFGFAPLLDTGFNRCRSDVKFLEFASRGVVPICANVGPYAERVRHRETGLLFGSPEELVEHLDALVTDEALARSIRQQAYDYVAGERVEAAHVDARLERFEALMRASGVEATGPDPWAWLESTRGFPDYSEGYTEEVMSPLETALYEGRIAQSWHLDHDKALACYTRARRCGPASASPHVHLAAVHLNRKEFEAADRSAKRALALRPSSFFAAAVAVEARVQLDGSRAANSLALRLMDQQPLNVGLFHAAARFASERGDLRAADKLLRRALTVHPHDFVAQSHLGLRAYHKKELKDALPLLTAFVKAQPKNPQGHFVLAAAHLAERDASAALASAERALELDPGNREMAGLTQKLRTLRSRASSGEKTQPGVFSPPAG